MTTIDYFKGLYHHSNSMLLLQINTYLICEICNNKYLFVTINDIIMYHLLFLHHYNKGVSIVRQISLTEVTPGMILARSILSSSGRVLLAAGITFTKEYIHKLKILNLDTLFIQDARYADITVPEYLSIETQQRALSILSATMTKVTKEGTFSVDAISNVASDIVEELVTQADVVIHLTGIAVYDNCTLSHSLNCSIYSALLARYAGFTIPQIKIITCGALLHDMGKIQIDKQILNKPGSLTDDEFAVMKQHPLLGFNLLTKKRLELSSLIAHMAWQHHEKIDGSGYPRGLKGEDILSYARLLSITDVYDAITAHRPYHNAMSPVIAYNIILAGLGTSFDEQLGKIFLSKIALYTPGTEVVLNTGELAVIVFVPASSPHRPTIRLMSYPDGTPYTPPEDINLADNPHISITTT